MIKFSHSVFALPFAFTSAFFAAKGIPSISQIFWIIVAMAGARSAAMGMNRVIDRKIDAKNPRTSGREIPAGVIKVTDALIFILISISAMVFAAYNLNPLCLKLSPLAVLVLFLYSYTKRFSYLSHIVLGIAVSGAPLGAWIAIKGSINIEILPMVIAVIAWLAGFDILYALQDIEFDRNHGLHSILQRFGIKTSLWLSRLFHLLTLGLLVITGLIFRSGIIYFSGMVLVGLLLLYEHALVKEDDLSKLDMAFFNMNGYISMAVFVFTFIDLVLV